MRTTGSVNFSSAEKLDGGGGEEAKETVGRKPKSNFTPKNTKKVEKAFHVILCLLSFGFYFNSASRITQ